MTSENQAAIERYALDDEVKAALVEVLKLYPGGFNAPEKLADRRRLMSDYLQQFPLNDQVTRLDDVVESRYDDFRIPIRIYRPLTGIRSEGVIFSIHGGGMVMGSIADDDGNAARLCLELGITVIALDYRLAPEHPFPLPVEDCFSVASWILDNAREIGIDINKSLIYGGSAGGGLAIATAMALRDRSMRNFSAVIAPYPMLDHRNALPSTHRILDLGAWDRSANIDSWRWYLGEDHSSQEVHPYASPLHAKDLTGLPEIFIDVGDADLFVDEDIQMVARLIEAGNSVEFHCYPGAYHACELFAPEAELSKSIWRARFDFMRKRV